MKLSVSKEYVRRIRKVLKSKLNGGNLVRVVNTSTVSLLRYSAVFVSWRKSELQAIDRKTRKLFTIYGALQPKSDVVRLYIPRKEGGRGLISTEDCVLLAIRGLDVYVHESEERLIDCQRRQDRWFRSCKCFEEIREKEKIRRLGGESSTWSVFEAD